MLTAKAKAGDTLVFTPYTALLTREVILESLPTVSQGSAKIKVTRGVHELRTHALIAASLAVNAYKAQQPWQNVWPDYESFKACMPLLWPAQKQDSLPPSALGESCIPISPDDLSKTVRLLGSFFPS